MTFYLLMCAWGYKAGGCTTPVAFPSQRACQFVAKHYREVAQHGGGVGVSVRCVGVRA